MKAVNRTEYSPQELEGSRTILSAGHAPGAYPPVSSSDNLCSVPAAVLAGVGSVRTAGVIGRSIVADRIFLIAPFQAHGDERVGRPSWGLGKKPLGCRPGVVQGLRLRRRRDLGLRRKHAQAEGARHGASEQEKVFHRECPAIQRPKAITAARRRHGRFDAASRPQ